MKLSPLSLLPLVLACLLTSWALAGPFDDLPTPTPEPTPTPDPSPTPEEDESDSPTPPAQFKRKKIVPDPVLRKRIHQGLADTRRSQLKAIRIRVSQGVVHLDGTVRTYQERALAEAVARTMPGVRQVNSNIRLAEGFRSRVKPRDRRSLTQIAVDEQLRDQVRRRLQRVPNVRLSQLQIEVYEKVAVISGSVADREQAESVRQVTSFTPEIGAVIMNVELLSEENDD